MAKKTDSRLNLHDILNRHSFDHAVICSFTFDAPFFEDYCLEKLTCLNNNGNITVFIDKTFYEEMLTGPESFRPKKANLRYLLYPVSVPGVFHPKIILLAGKNKGKLIVGSANFTRSGLTTNAEMVGFYEYETEKNERYKLLFQQAFGYILQLAEKNPSENLHSNLNDISRNVTWLQPDPDEEIQDSILIHNLTESLWSQLIDGITPPVDKFSILSRFFDSSPEFLTTIERDLQPKEIEIYTQNGITNMTPQWLNHESVKNGRTKIFLCEYKDEGYIQPLHAKAFAIQKNEQCRISFGSANFSTPALLRTADSGNAEILLTISDVQVKDFRAEKLFDPAKTKVLLKNAAGLNTAESHEDEIIKERKHHEIKLFEATFKDSNHNPFVSIRAEIPADLPSKQLKAVLIFGNQSVKELNLINVDEGLYQAAVTPSIKKRLDNESTIVYIDALTTDDYPAESNRILVTNVKDIKTDKPVRRERHIKEAQQNPELFLAVLRELTGAGDNEALLTFFNYCEIPFSGMPRPKFLGTAAKPVWDGGEGMRKLGEKNLKIYTELHPAAIAFFDRHFKKLQKHVDSMDVSGIENFLHIFIAMGGILRSQVERAVVGLELKTTPVTTQEWSICRDYNDIYYGKFKQLMDFLWKQYLSNLIKENKKADIQEKFLPDLQPINDLCADMLSYQERVENLRIGKLRYTNQMGKVITPGYFHSVFNPEKWNGYSNQIRTNLNQVETAIMEIA